MMCKKEPLPKITKKLLLCGLDHAGKTTLIKSFNHSRKDEKQLVTTTPFINVEIVKIPSSQEDCIVYDMSGQVSTNAVSLM